MTKVFLNWLSGIGFLLLGQAALAAGPCPDGNFNPQNRVCMCPGGGYVGPGQWCESGDGGVKIIPLPKTWGAIAIDTSRQKKGSGWGNSQKSQAEANRDALNACGLSTCRVVLKFTNSCGAIAADNEGKGIWGGGVDVNKDRALQKAANACYDKGAKACSVWVPPSCANAPR